MEDCVVFILDLMEKHNFCTLAIGQNFYIDVFSCKGIWEICLGRKENLENMSQVFS